MDAELQIDRGCRTTTRSVTAGGACVELCQYDPRRVLLAFSTLASPAVCQLIPRGTFFDADLALTSPFLLPLASKNGGTMILTLADHGPLVQGNWFCGIDLATPTWTVYEVIDLQIPCNLPQQTAEPPLARDMLSEWLGELQSGRGFDSDYSMGMGPKPR